MRFNTETIVGLFVLSSLAVFAYLSFYLGIFNFDNSHVKYYAYFKDISGIPKKSDIRISGVKVGWIESFKLQENHLVKVKLMIHKNFLISKDYKTAIKQEGFLGSKYLDLIPNEYNSSEFLKPGECIPDINCIPISSMDDLLIHMKNLTENLEKLTSAQEINLLKDQVSKISDRFQKAICESKENFDSNINKLTDSAKITCDNINNIVCSAGSSLNSFKPAISFIEKTKNTKFVVDSHIELAPKLTKFYFDTHLYPNKSYFYLLGLRLADSRKIDYCKVYNRWGLNLQFGAIYDPIAIKLGIFEGYLGLSGEYLLPITKKVNFLTSVQAFDFFRTHKLKPYLRWLNKLYISPNFYIAAGIDNMINPKYRTGFIGAGIRFSS